MPLLKPRRGFDPGSRTVGLELTIYWAFVHEIDTIETCGVCILIVGQPRYVFRSVLV